MLIQGYSFSCCVLNNVFCVMLGYVQLFVVSKQKHVFFVDMFMCVCFDGRSYMIPVGVDGVA